MIIKLQNTISEPNKIGKDITDILQIEGTLKEETSIIDPVILIKYEGTLNNNYMTIEEFGRSYFINNITSIRTGLWEISAHIDVLETYRDEIKENRAVIKRQENDWNLYIDDGTFKSYQNPLIYTRTFPNGFNETNNEFVLVVAGSAEAVANDTTIEISEGDDVGQGGAT